MNDVSLDFLHRQTTHCESGATANLLRYHGMDISEPITFGIGGGLFFGYFPFLRMAHIRVTTFRKAPGAIFPNAMKRLGVAHSIATFFSRTNARSKLDQLLDQSTPVGCQVGFFWLPYVPRAMRSHFNAHNIVIYGRRGSDYLVSEPGLQDVQILHAADLERARFARGGMNPRGKMFWLREDRSTKTIDLRRPIREGILDTCHSMLDIPIPLLGIKGIRRLARDLLKWGAKLPIAETRDNVNQIVIMQEVVGSGGAGFRFMYAAFLQQASEILANPALAEASRQMTAIGDKWREFALAATRFVKDRQHDGENLALLSSMLMNLADREKALFLQLRPIARAL
ncbi:MAG: BtrH N-terminal domain-containing protein [Opitutaceae bacterium]|jgi:hypothetical protein